MTKGWINLRNFAITLVPFLIIVFVSDAFVEHLFPNGGKFAFILKVAASTAAFYIGLWVEKNASKYLQDRRSH
jgi:hypothetical protein